MRTPTRVLGAIVAGSFIAAFVFCTPGDPTAGTDTSGTDGSTPSLTSFTAGYTAYDIGSPTLADLWIDPTGGDDSRTGATRALALRTLAEAWNRIPDTLTSTGYRINIVAGTVPFDEACQNYYGGKHGTRDYPIIIQAADGRGTSTILAGLNFAEASFLYLIDLRLRAGGDAPTWGNNILHFDRCDNVLVRGAAVVGPVPDTSTQINESFKANQCQNLYLEDSELYGGWLTGVDWFSVQGGHILGNRIHGFESDWGTYLKGGSAYIVVAANEYYDCQLGFSAGQGSNFEVMRTPWLHYEAYDVKFVNNLLHDIRGNGMGVQGGYNILLAYNTLYRVGTDPSGYGMLLMARGSRGCEDTSENGVDNANTLCGANLSAGGWCPAATGPAGGPRVDDIIPNRNVNVFNNIFYNPTGTLTLNGTFDFHNSATSPAGSNIPSPALADDNLRIRGNIVWDGTGDHLGITGDGSSGCPDTNTACNTAQLLADNRVNSMEPQLIDPAGGNYRPTVGGNVLSAGVTAVPDFSWADAPIPPTVPAGNNSNAIAATAEGSTRSPDRPGAF